MTQTALVTQSDLELQFGAERVAEIMSVVASDGSSTGAANATVLAYAIRMGSAEAMRVLLPVYGRYSWDSTTCPDTLKQLVGILVMHAGALRRPEYARKIEESPYFGSWKQARADLKDLRDAYQELDKAQPPANSGGQIATNAHPDVRPFTFLASATTGEGGFNSGDF